MIHLLLASQILFADLPSLTIDPLSSDLPKDHHLYFDLGTAYILPQLGVGFRQQYGYLGYDLALKGTIVPIPIGCGPIVGGEIWFPWISGAVRLLYYPKPNLESQWYIGGGVTNGHLWITCPNLVFGKSYQTASGMDRFWQLGAEIPLDENPPLVFFSYGFCL